MTGTEAILIFDKVEYQLKLKFDIRKSSLEGNTLDETESNIYMITRDIGTLAWVRLRGQH